MKTKHILIVGGGVIGLSAAYYLTQRGHRVTIVDRVTAKHEGCSFGNAGLVVPSHFVPLAAPGMVALGLKWMWNPETPFYVKPRFNWDLLSWGWRFWRSANAAHVTRCAPLLRDFHSASRTCFEELAALPNNDFAFVRKGLLVLCKTEQALEEEAKAAERARELAIPAEILDVKQTAALEPYVRMDVAGSIYFPKDGHLTPSLFMDGLRRLIERAEAQFLWNTEVLGWRAGGNSIEAVLTSQGELTADEYVICGGAWSPLVTRGLQLKLPIQAGKGYSLTLPNPRRLPAISAIFTEARVAATPMGSSLRFGGTMEIAGLNLDINPVRVQGIIKAVPRYYPEFTPDDFRGIQPWRGLRPCSPDGLPYVGRCRCYANLSIATGHAMMGVSLGPFTGKLMAQILSGEKPSLDLTLLDPDRYA